MGHTKKVVKHSIDNETLHALSSILNISKSLNVRIKSYDFLEQDFNKQIVPTDNRIGDISFSHGERATLLLDEKLRESLTDFCKRKNFISTSNSIVYMPLSYMAWHTNSDLPGLRHYYTYTEGKSVFRYIDPVTKEQVDSVDDIGWTHRTFYVSDKDLLWHTIWTEKERYSFGFISSVDNTQY